MGEYISMRLGIHPALATLSPIQRNDASFLSLRVMFVLACVPNRVGAAFFHGTLRDRLRAKASSGKLGTCWAC